MQQSGLEPHIEPAVQAVGCQLMGVERASKPGGVLLRIYIDKEGGLGIDDCAKASRQIDATLKVSGVAGEDFSLEVSSPGLDRKLFTLEQLLAHLGKSVKVRLQTAIAETKSYEGELISANETALSIKEESGEQKEFSLTNVSWVRLIPEF